LGVLFSILGPEIGYTDYFSGFIQSLQANLQYYIPASFHILSNSSFRTILPFDTAEKKSLYKKESMYLAVINT